MDTTDKWTIIPETMNPLVGMNQKSFHWRTSGSMATTVMASDIVNASAWQRVAPLLRCLPPLSCEFEAVGDGSLVVCCHTICVGPETGPRVAVGATSECQRLALWRRRLRALEMLALVWLVDLDGWAYLMGQLGVSVDPKPLGRSTDRLVPAYAIRFRDDDSVGFVGQVVQLLQSTPPSFPPSDDEDEACLEAHNVLLTLASERHGDALVFTEYQWNEWRIPFRVVEGDAPLFDSDILAHWLEQARDVLSRFEFVGIDIDKHTLRALSTDFADRVSSHVARGVPLHRVTFGVLEGGASTPRHRLGQLMTALTGPNGATALTCDQTNYRTASEALLSALTGSPGVTRLKALQLMMLGQGETTAERRSCLLWLMFALFSQHSRHAIHSAVATAFSDFTSHDLEWFDDFIRNTQASPRLELLIPEAFDEYISGESVTTTRWLSVPQGDLIRLEERLDWRDQASLCFREIKRFRVLKDETTSAFIDVLVPGYGHCYVERNESTVIVEEPATPWRLDQHAVRSIELGMFDVNAEEQRVVTSFLSLVGVPIRELRLTRWFSTDIVIHNGLEFPVLVSIVRSCPQLSCLVLERVPIVSADAIVDVFQQESTQMVALDLGSQPFISQRHKLAILWLVSK